MSNAPESASVATPLACATMHRLLELLATHAGAALAAPLGAIPTADLFVHDAHQEIAAAAAGTRDDAHAAAALAAGIASALSDADFPPVDAPSEVTPDAPRSTGADALATCFTRVVTALRAAHPRAPAILALRIDGLNDREIADQLGLGLRLVRQIRHDAAAAWQQTT